MSFASPVFWKIQDLANNITKKNIKSTVAELNQLLKLYGPEARQFLLACLIHKVEVRDQRGLSHKIQLLNHEITELAVLPNFPTVIREAFRIAQDLGDSRNRKLTEEYLAGFCKQVKLNTTQQILVAVGLEESDDESISHQAVLFLKKTIPELGQSGTTPQGSLPKNVVHTLLRIVRTNPNFKPQKFEQACVKAILKGSYSKLATGGNAASFIETRVLMPLLEDEFSLEYRGDVQVVENGPLSEDIFKSLSIAKFILDIGYTCATSQSYFETTILKFGKVSRRSDKLKNTAGVRVFSPLTEADVADILRSMAHTLSSLKNDCSATLDHAFRINRRQSSWDLRESNKQLSSWNMHVVASSLSSANFPSLDWIKVLRGFDHPEFDLPDAAAFAWLIQVFRKASGMKTPSDFPLEVLFEPWKNPTAQLSFLKYAIGASPTLFSFAHCASQLPFTSEVVGDGSPNAAWSCRQLLTTLFELANRGDCFAQVRHILEAPEEDYPAVLLVGLVMISCAERDWSGMCHSITQRLLNKFLWPSARAQEESTRTLALLWDLNHDGETNAKELILNGIDQIVRQHPAPAGLERAVSVVVKLSNGLETLFNSPSLSDKFKIDVACEVASNNATYGTSLKLSAFLTPRLAEPEVGSDVPRRHQGDLNVMTRPTSRMLFLRTCLAWLRQRQFELSVDILVEFHRNVRSFRGLMDDEMRSMYKSIYEEDCERYPELHQLDGPDVEEQANTYFQKLYTQKMSIDEVVDMLRRYKRSTDPHEREIFTCMIHNLFDEFQHLPNYPDRELQFTGTIFGALVRHELVQEMKLGLILRYVLEALQRPPPDKMYFFGFKALEQFMSRLHEWPQYCNLIAAIPHLQRHPEVAAFVKQEIAKVVKANASASGNKSPDDASAKANAASSSAKPATPNAQSDVRDDSQQQKTTHAQAPPAKNDASAHVPDFMQQRMALARAQGGVSNAALSQNNALKQLQAHQQQKQAAAVAARGAASAAPVPAPRSVSDYLGFAPISPAEAAAPSPPNEDIVNSFNYIVNNLSAPTIQKQVQAAKPLVVPESCSWIAHFLVTGRVATQPKYHNAIFGFVVGIKDPLLTREVLRYSYLMSRELLLSEAVIEDTAQRTKLKNLGAWLGKMTLKRDKPVLFRHMDLKQLLYGAYESGRLIAAIPFITKVLDGVKESRVFMPPNPWTMAHLSALKEIYELKDLKMFLQFEVEQLCSNLSINIADIPRADHLKNCTPPRVPSSGDFKTDVSASQRATAAEPGVSGPVSLAGIKVIPNMPQEFHRETAIPNLAAYVHVPRVALFKQFPQLLPAVSLAVDQAIREIIQPVVERSVTIACKTTKDLILKDFAHEPDSKLMSEASRLMVTKLAGNLALVTCKEPLRTSIDSHLQKLLTVVIVDGPNSSAVIKDASDNAAKENLDLGCMLIEKAATEKAIRDISEQLRAALTVRERHAASSSATPGKPKPFFDPTYQQANAAAMQYAPNLPPALRPSAGGLTPMQRKLYEAFNRLPTHRLRMAPNRGASAPSGVDARSQGNAGSESQSWDSATGTESGPSPTASAGESTNGGASATFAPSPNAEGQPSTARQANVDFKKLTGLLQQLRTAEDHIIATAKGDMERALKLAEANPDVRSILQIIRSMVETIPASATAPPAPLLQFAQVVFNELVRLRLESTLHFQLRLAVLRQLRPSTGPVATAFVKEITNFLIAAAQDPKATLQPRKHHALTVGLARTQLLAVNVYDSFLASSVAQAMKSANRSAAMGTYELAVHVCASCSNEHTVPVENFQRTIRALESAADALSAASAEGKDGAEAIDADLLSNLQCDVKTLVRLSKLPTSGVGRDASDPQMKARAALLLDKWVEICTQNKGSNDQVVSGYLAALQRQHLLAGNTVTKQFFKTLLRLSVFRAMQALATRPPAGSVSPAEAEQKQFANPAYVYMDSLARLVLLIVKCAEDTKKVYLFHRILDMFVEVLVQEHDANRSRGADWDQRPYLRIFISLLNLLSTPGHAFAGTIDALIKIVAVVFHKLKPARFPAFAFAWLELVSHRTFMPRLLRAGRPVAANGAPDTGSGWFQFQQLMLDLFEALEPHLRYCRMTHAVRTLYQGTLRVVLVLLHDFPEFLCDFHFSFCDVIPATCIQLRNLLLSAFPRNMALPDPFTPTLKVDLLPEIRQPPRILSKYHARLTPRLRESIDAYVAARGPASLLETIAQELFVAESPDNGSSEESNTPSYDVHVINAVVMYVGVSAVAQAGRDSAVASQMVNSAHMDVFVALARRLRPQGRYMLLNAMANQLRYPNSHTNYFSSTLLQLFVKCSDNELILEQITRVLLERLVVNRPHPWGLMITFIELVKNNKQYNFWSHSFTVSDPEVRRLVESVARSCVGPAQLNNIPTGSAK